MKVTFNKIKDTLDFEKHCEAWSNFIQKSNQSQIEKAINFTEVEYFSNRNGIKLKYQGRKRKSFPNPLVYVILRDFNEISKNVNLLQIVSLNEKLFGNYTEWPGLGIEIPLILIERYSDTIYWPTYSYYLMVFEPETDKSLNWMRNILLSFGNKIHDGMNRFQGHKNPNMYFVFKWVCLGLANDINWLISVYLESNHTKYHDENLFEFVKTYCFDGILDYELLVYNGIANPISNSIYEENLIEFLRLIKSDNSLQMFFTNQ